MTEIMKNSKTFKFLSAGSLKWIAIIAMFIDHFFAGLFAPLYSGGFFVNTNIIKYGVDIYEI